MKSPIAGLFLAGLLAAGCSNVSLEAGSNLAASGAANSKTVYDEAAATEKAFKKSPELVVLRLGIIRQTDKPKLTSFDHTYKVGEALQARTRAMGALVPVYKSFGALVQYDATGETEKAIGDLVEEVNKAAALASALTATPIAPITATIGEILKITGGLIAEEMQKRKAKAMSEIIRQALERLTAIIRAEKQYAVALREDNLLEVGEARRLLLARGLASYDETVRALLDELGLKAVKDVDAAMRQNPGLKDGIAALLQYREQAALEAIKDGYDALIDLLAKTAAEHRKFEEGKPLDLATLQVLVSRLQGYYERVKNAEAPKSGGEKS